MARLELLKQIKIYPKVIVADVNESATQKELPNNLASRLALAKAHKVVDQIEHGVIVAADTVVAAGRRILPKALNNKDIRYCLEILSGRRHRVYTGVCIIKKCDNTLQTRQKIVQTIIKFKNLTHAEIDLYCDLEEGINKAGGYSISGFAQSFILFLSGSYSNVMGLPLYETSNMLHSFCLL